ncbi:histidine--tRNA ligase [Cryomorpha ignava]|uniref:Histidine--tRNA ligase n=1 Tax=Cryomorpha ignava TaxID=101383 RepID=A0A7K3WU54_9FLAO|nr:histidine--tRNA ligase [Cryomorpha ignava]NEN25209.1 histidine--tRNA ligase [Cryomorpha ignava]
MSKQYKPSTPKGTRDFLPTVVQRRNYIFDTIKTVFEHYGYQPIETPAMENLETLTGKYGEEGDRLIFKILARGEKLNKALADFNQTNLTEEALRYDLTVPFARFVVQHQNDLAFPFRRYQIQPVWRADRPQKGRYREFFQCDADVIGTDSLRCEVEIVQMLDNVFTKLGLPVEIKINNRKLLTALAAYVGEADKLIPLTIAIDKLDKMPLDKVLADLDNQGFSAEAQTKLKTVLEAARDLTDSAALMDKMEQVFAGNADGEKGLEELRYVFSKVKTLGLETSKLRFDMSLARGLNYYTGAIFEVVPRTDEQVGSISGGGRYDDLTGVFGMPGMSGVGISFGADRIYDMLEARDGFPKNETAGTELLFVNFGETEADFCHELLGSIRKAGIRAELYPDASKMKKQMKYANDKQIKFVAMVGEDEMAADSVTLKNMESGEQELIGKNELISKLKML